MGIPDHLTYLLRNLYAGQEVTVRTGHGTTDWLNRYKNKTHIYAVYNKPTLDPKTYRLKVRGWKNIFHANGKQKKAGVAILVSDKIDLKIKNITRDKEGYYIVIKGPIQEEDITIVNICASNIVQFSSVTQWCLTLLDPVNRSTPGLPVYHQLDGCEFE